MSQQSQGKNVMIQGRIVWTSGDLFKGRQKTDQNTRQPIIDQRTGQPRMEYGFGLAVPKSELQPGRSGAALWAAMHEEAYQIYPSRQLPPSFAMKYKDGDGVDQNGQPFANREGYAGHLIFALTTSIPIKYYRFENGMNVQIDDGIKCGDYVEVQVNVVAHGPIGQGKPGLYLNPNAVRFLAYGAPIVNAPSGDQIFGNQAFSGALPPGASLTPIAPTTPMPSQTPAQPMTPPTPMAQQPVQPHYGVVPQQFQPPMGNGFGQPQAAPAPTAPSYPAASPGPVPAAVPTMNQYGAPTMAPGGVPSAYPSNGMPPVPR